MGAAAVAGSFFPVFVIVKTGGGSGLQVGAAAAGLALLTALARTALGQPVRIRLASADLAFFGVLWVIILSFWVNLLTGVSLAVQPFTNNLIGGLGPFVLVYIAVRFAARTRGSIERLSTTYYRVILFTAVIGIIDYLRVAVLGRPPMALWISNNPTYFSGQSIDPATYGVPRVMGFMSEPSLFVSVLLTGICLALWRRSVAGAAFLLAGLILTFSPTLIVILLLPFLLVTSRTMSEWFLRRRGRRASAASLVRLAALIAIPVALFGAFRGLLLPVMGRLPGINAIADPAALVALDTSSLVRLDSIRAGFFLWSERPLFGWGWGTPLAEEMDRHLSLAAITRYLEGAGKPILGPHSAIVDLAVRAGLAGVLAAGLFFALALRSPREAEPRSLSALHWSWRSATILTIVQLSLVSAQWPGLLHVAVMLALLISTAQALTVENNYASAQ